MAQRAEKDLARKLPLDGPARENLLEMADGDGRALLNLIEQIAAWKVDGKLDTDALSTRLMKRAARYDKSGDEHYNLISALHKSVRGSDPDAALYWFARMLKGGEDPRFLARRITRMAVEDIGLADPQAQHICLQAWQTFERLGSPEGELALAQALTYLALAPKSNAVYAAYKNAMAAAAKTGSEPPPKHILNAPTSLMKDIGYGDGYPRHLSSQNTDEVIQKRILEKNQLEEKYLNDYYREKQEIITNVIDFEKSFLKVSIHTIL
jgi:putative ATPase